MSLASLYLPLLWHGGRAPASKPIYSVKELNAMTAMERSTLGFCKLRQKQQMQLKWELQPKTDNKPIKWELQPKMDNKTT